MVVRRRQEQDQRNRDSTVREHHPPRYRRGKRDRPGEAGRGLGTDDRGMGRSARWLARVSHHWTPTGQRDGPAEPRCQARSSRLRVAVLRHSVWVGQQRRAAAPERVFRSELSRCKRQTLPVKSA